MANKITAETAEKIAIKQYLGYFGCYFYHNLQGIGAKKGLPDLTAIDRKGQTWQIEVKAPNGRQSDWQKEFQKEWEAKGGHYICGGLDEVRKFIK
jgi:hypothetical protein